MGIYYKFALKCNGSKIPPNKEQITKVPFEKMGEHKKDKKIVILKPSIDRLVFKFDLKKHVSEKAFKEEYVEGINSYLDTSTKDTDEGLFQYVPPKVLNCKRNRGWFKPYKKNIWLHHKPSGEKILIQADPRNQSHAFLRFDLNPQELGYEGMKFFKKELQLLMANNFDFQFIANQTNTIRDIHICVDILGVDADDMRVEYHPHGNQKYVPKHQIYASETGRKETIYPNFNKYGANSVYLYNKKKELLGNGHNTKYGEALHTRIELRVDTKKPISKLGGLINHLKKVDVSAISYQHLKQNEYDRIYFFDYALRRNIEKALAPITDNKTRDEYEKAYNEALTNIWNPKELWKHWPEVVKSSGLIDE